MHTFRPCVKWASRFRYHIRPSITSNSPHSRRVFGAAVGRVQRSITKADPIVRFDDDTAIWSRSTVPSAFLVPNAGVNGLHGSDRRHNAPKNVSGPIASGLSTSTAVSSRSSRRDTRRTNTKPSEKGSRFYGSRSIWTTPASSLSDYSRMWFIAGGYKVKADLTHGIFDIELYLNIGWLRVRVLYCIVTAHGTWPYRVSHQVMPF